MTTPSGVRVIPFDLPSSRTRSPNVIALPHRAPCALRVRLLLGVVTLRVRLLLATLRLSPFLLHVTLALIPSL